MVGIAILLAGLLDLAAAFVFDRVVVRRAAPGSPEHTVRRRVHLLLIVVGIGLVAYGIWHLNNVPQGPNI